MSDVLVKVECVSKKFCRSLKKSLWYGMQDLGNEVLGRRHGGNVELRQDEFWAVDDVSFELRRGECLGLIGRNGAGKTTLLRMLNGLIKPDGGRIEITGRVNALISLGAGFNPILTGRENIYVNASVLGLSKMEVDNKLDEIIDFAEIKEFIDSPVQNYSSGMQIRLGFAVATALEPDVLLLDEVLAVGDVAFRSKCFQRIGTLIDKCAVIFVSHDAVQMSRICERSLYLKQGKSVLHDRTQEVLQIYSKEALPAKGEKSIILDDCVKRFSCVASDAPVKFGESIEIIVDADFTESVRVGLALAALREGEVPVAQSDFTELLNHSLQTRHKLKLNLGPLFLKEGEYSLSITILNETKKNTLVHAVHYVTIQVCGPKGCGVYYQVPCSEG